MLSWKKKRHKKVLVESKVEFMHKFHQKSTRETCGNTQKSCNWSGVKENLGDNQIIFALKLNLKHPFEVLSSRARPESL